MQKFYRLNQYIFAPNLRVLDEKGKQVGLFSKDEAIRRARELGLDLVEIASNAKPPVAKIIDFKKFKYLESKREQEIKKKAKDVEVKEVHLRPFIGEHDFEVRASQAKEFFKDGNRVKIVIKFQGREFSKKQFGYDRLKRFTEVVSGIGEPQGEPRWEGRTLTLFLGPVKGINAKDEDKKNR